MALPGTAAAARPPAVRAVPPAPRALHQGLSAAAAAASSLPPRPFAGLLAPVRRPRSGGLADVDAGAGVGWRRRLAALAAALTASERAGKDQEPSRWSRAQIRAVRIALGAGIFFGCIGNFLQLLAALPTAFWDAAAIAERGLAALPFVAWQFLRSSMSELGTLITPGPQRDMLQLLLATTLVVPAIRRLNTSPIIGFLLMGVLMGPSGFDLISNLHSTHALAELGIIFFLFEMGLELSVGKVLAMKNDVFGLGAAQYVITMVLIAVLSGFLVPSLPGSGRLVLGGALALSSSAFVLQLMRDQGQLASPCGRASFGVLLFQDLAVVPLLVVVPLLAGSGGGGSLLGALGAAGARGALALGIIFVLGKTALDQIFRFVMRTKSPEAFLAITLGTVLLSSGITEGLGLSNTLGAFFGGILLSETSYRHQIEADIAPFRGMLLGLFFITVGFSIDLRLVASSWMILLPLMIGLIVLKAGVVIGACLASGMATASAIQASALLAPGGEFAFVVFSLAEKLGLLLPQQTRLLVTATALSMAFTPMLAKVGDKAASLLRKSGGSVNLEGKDAEGLAIIQKVRQAPNGFVVVCGYGRIGRIICELLDAEGGIDYFVIERDPAKSIRARSAGLPIFLADAGRRDNLENFHIGEARLVIVAISDKDGATTVAAYIQELYPKVDILVRAQDDEHQEYLQSSLGLDAVVPALPPDDTLVSLPFGGEVLRRLGYDDSEVSTLVEEQRRQIYQGGDTSSVKMSEQALADVFSTFDDDNSGTISADELQTAFKTLGKEFTAEQVNKMMMKADVDNSGEVTLEEFKILMDLKEFKLGA